MRSEAVRRLCVALTLLSAATAARGQLLFSGLTGQGSGSNNSYTLGTQFTITAGTLTVTQLGAYDSGRNGLSNAVQVGLWRTSDQSLLASVTVPAGTGATLVEDWRFVPLTTSVQLTAGTTYRIATYYGVDPTHLDADPTGGSVSVLPGVTATAGSVVRNGSFAYPSTLQATNRFAANALLPEPGTAAVIAAAAGAMALRRRRV